MLVSENYETHKKRIFRTLYLEEWKKLCRAEHPFQSLEKAIQYYRDFIKPEILNYIVYEPLSERFGLAPFNKLDFLKHIEKLEKDRNLKIEDHPELNANILAFAKSILLLIESLQKIQIQIANNEFRRIGDFLIIAGIENPWIEFNEKEIYRHSEIFYRQLSSRYYEQDDDSKSMEDFLKKEINAFSKLLSKKEEEKDFKVLESFSIFEEDVIENLNTLIKKNPSEYTERELYTFDKKNIESYALIIAMKRYLSLLETSIESIKPPEEKTSEIPRDKVLEAKESSYNVVKEKGEEKNEEVFYSDSNKVKQAPRFVEEDNVIDEEAVLNWIKEES